MARYRCVNEFVDLTTGARVEPGSIVSIDDPVRAERLKRAQCIVEVPDVPDLPEADTRPAPVEQATVSPPEQDVHPANRRRRGR